MSSNQYHSQLYSLVTGIKVSSISKYSIEDTKIQFPCIEEQQKIAGFLSAVDIKMIKYPMN